MCVWEREMCLCHKDVLFFFFIISILQTLPQSWLLCTFCPRLQRASAISFTYTLTTNARTVFRHIKPVVKATVSQLPGVIYIAMVTLACFPFESLPAEELESYAAAAFPFNAFCFPSCHYEFCYRCNITGSHLFPAPSCLFASLSWEQKLHLAMHFIQIHFIFLSFGSLSAIS